jgi:hypothetical protein
MIIAVGALIVFAVIALAVLWAAPWDDDGGVDTSPGISDQIGGGGDGGTGGTDGGSGGTGGGDGGTGGGGGEGSGGGAAPAQ